MLVKFFLVITTLMLSFVMIATLGHFDVVFGLWQTWIDLNYWWYVGVAYGWPVLTALICIFVGPSVVMLEPTKSGDDDEGDEIEPLVKGKRQATAG